MTASNPVGRMPADGPPDPGSVSPPERLEPITPRPEVTELEPPTYDVHATVTHPAPPVLLEMRGTPPRRTSSVGAEGVTGRVAAQMLRSLADELDPPQRVTRSSWSEDFGRREGASRGTPLATTLPVAEFTGPGYEAHPGQDHEDCCK